MNSKQKGARGERELANLLKEYGFNTERTGWQQSNGGESVADVSGIEGLHIEVKRRERFSDEEALRQSENDCRKKEIPIVIYRRNREEWKVCLRLEPFIRLIMAAGINKLVGIAELINFKKGVKQ